ncbi:MAG: hypothetical protein Q9170_004650 [Blastenia crenularia]
MKCNNSLPKCSNCDAHDKSCIYDCGDKKSRPTRDQLERLEAENRKLQAQLAAGTTGNDGRLDAEDLNGLTGSLPTQGSSSGSEALPSSTIALGQAVGFHGPSSILFDEISPEQTVGQASDTHKITDSLDSARLMAIAATQQRLEETWLLSEDFDSDGIYTGLAKELLSLYWRTANSAFLLVYRPAFMRDYAAEGPMFSTMLLNAIYYSSSRHLDGESYRKYCTDVETLNMQFHTRFKDLLRQSFDESCITTIQALLVMSSALAGVGEERNAAWIYSGMAFRMMFDLGLHTDKQSAVNKPKASIEDQEIGRRLFWSAFVIDKLQSFYYGRPPTIREADTAVPLEFLDQYAEMEPWTPMGPTSTQIGQPAPAYVVSSFSRACYLSIIMDKILDQIYSERQKWATSESMASYLSSLNQDLARWYRTIPFHFRFAPAAIGKDETAPPSPYTYAVILLYYALHILAHRPFLSHGHLRDRIPNMALESFSTCAFAANKIATYLESYKRVHTFQRAPYILLYATYVSATIHVRIAAQQHLESNATAHLKTCLNVFDENQKERSSAQRAKTIIESLAARLSVGIVNSSLSSAVPQQQASCTPPNMGFMTNGDSSPQPEQNASQQDVGIVPDPAWNINDLDLDAMLQSFNTSPSSFDYAPLPSKFNTSAWSTTANDPSRGNGIDDLYGFDSASF